MNSHGFTLPNTDTNSTIFDFLVIFCSFCVYSLVPGVWNLEPFTTFADNYLDNYRFAILFFIIRLMITKFGSLTTTEINIYTKIPANTCNNNTANTLYFINPIQ